MDPQTIASTRHAPDTDALLRRELIDPLTAKWHGRTVKQIRRKPAFVRAPRHLTGNAFEHFSFDCNPCDLNGFGAKGQAPMPARLHR